MSDDLRKHKYRDRIEELEASLLSATMDGYDMAKHEYRDRIEQLEEVQLLFAMDKINLRGELAGVQGKLEKALESLTVIDALDPEGMVNGCSQSALIGLVSRMGAIARNTLAELEQKP